MPKMYDYLQEVKLGTDRDTEFYFNEALKQVFNESYLKKIESEIKKTM